MLRYFYTRMVYLKHIDKIKNNVLCFNRTTICTWCVAERNIHKAYIQSVVLTFACFPSFNTADGASEKALSGFIVIDCYLLLLSQSINKVQQIHTTSSGSKSTV